VASGIRDSALGTRRDLSQILQHESRCASPSSAYSESPHRPETPLATPAPDWLCEILSPSTSSFDRAKKLAIDAREGLAWAWLIDPLARTLEVLKLEGGRWTILATHADNEVVRPEPFDAVELELAARWGEVSARQSSSR
jgi:Uma2 family endonuclease